MAQTSVNFRMDAELKEAVEEICRKMGMNLTTAITIFCTKVAQERRIPFEITADPDPFYSESNIRYLEKKTKDYRELYQKPAAPIESDAAGFLHVVSQCISKGTLSKPHGLL